MPPASFHTTVAAPAAVTRRMGRAVTVASGAEIMLAAPHWPPDGLDFDQSWSTSDGLNVRSIQTAIEFPAPSMAAEASHPSPPALSATVEAA
jgi:hypothetical protein